MIQNGPNRELFEELSLKIKDPFEQSGKKETLKGLRMGAGEQAGLGFSLTLSIHRSRTMCLISLSKSEMSSLSRKKKTVLNMKELRAF